MKLERPIVLTVDGFSGHHSFKLFQWCHDNGVILIILYPNSTHILQVCDVAMFSPIKAKYVELHQQWKIDNPEKFFNEIEFVKILKRVNDETIKEQSIINGWRATGLQPFDFQNVKFDRVIGKKQKVTILSNELVNYDLHDIFPSVSSTSDIIASTSSSLHKENRIELPIMFEDSGFEPENHEGKK